LIRNGFSHVTRLWYLRHGLRRIPRLEPRPDVALQTYASCGESLFQDILLRTYSETLDCPEINGLRSGEEILQGHCGQAQHDPQLWWMACVRNQPSGVLLLTNVPDSDAVDLAYLGVVPGQRRCGLGRQLALKGLHEARSLGATQMTLAVDERNVPAWNLYARLGFERAESREVFLLV
jgi:ribosomal protein S18 acetylase RimI-like enzyme